MTVTDLKAAADTAHDKWMAARAAFATTRDFQAVAATQTAAAVARAKWVHAADDARKVAA